MRTPGDYIGWGIAIILISAMVFAVAAAATETPVLFAVGAVPATIGCILIQIGIIAWGVAVGVRTATGRS